MATLSLLGIHNIDPSVLSPEVFQLPAGLQHEILDPMLLAETAELEILYPEPSTLSTVIKAWSTARSPSWGRMAAALDAEYNPIHNYDRSETWSEQRDSESAKDGSRNSTGSGQASGSQSGAGFNSSQANVPRETNTGTSSSTQADTWNEDGTGSETVQRSGTVSGNIGVTTSQQMIEAELELRRTDIYRQIISEFIKMFCLGVY